MTTTTADCPLTGTQLRILELLMDGLTYEQIARQLGRSPSTVRSHLHTSYRRLGVGTSYQAVLECVRLGWLSWSNGHPEQATLMRIEDLMRQLVRGVAGRRSQPRLTPAQRSYLEAFEDHLQARPGDERADARQALTGALDTMLREAEVPLPTEGRPDDLLDWLVTTGADGDRRSPV